MTTSGCPNVTQHSYASRAALLRLKRQTQFVLESMSSKSGLFSVQFRSLLIVPHSLVWIGAQCAKGLRFPLQEFVGLAHEYLLHGSVQAPFESFARGFRRVCNSPLFDVLSPDELEAIVAGDDDLDFRHLRQGES
eukprot:3456573-Amphidinium_carterae.1